MFSLNIKQVLQALSTSKNGLKSDEAARRLKQNGKNEIIKNKKRPLVVRFFKQFLNVMVMILLFAAVISIIVAITNKNYSDLFDGFVILFIVIMNAIIGVCQESKAQACLDDLQKQTKTTVKVLRDGLAKYVDSTEIVVGDIVELKAGDVAIADMRLLETNNFACDESSLTGESVPAEKQADVVLDKSTALADRKNMVYSGSMVVNGRAIAVVVETGNNTELGKIAKILFTTKKDKTPLQRAIDKIGKLITVVVLSVCAVILIVELVTGKNIFNAVMTSVALAVAAIPESLPAVITIILAFGVQSMAKCGCIIKNLNAVETLGSCEIICSDKTGTLTLNRMRVVEVFTNEINLQVEGDNFKELVKCMHICNHAKKDNDKYIGEPTEVAIYEYAEKFYKREQIIVYEIPFDSTRKLMSVVVNDGGVTSYTKGAPERVLAKCSYIKENDKIIELNNTIKQKIKDAIDQMSDKAYRVLAFAGKSLSTLTSNEDIEQNMVFLGLVGIVDEPRPEVKHSIKKCFDAGLTPVMITGDHKRTAFAIAKELGIAKSINEVITGEEIDSLTNEELQKICKNYTVYARVSPEHKVRIVKAFKCLKKIVAMTGDGVNDAPSLKIADIGVGMGKAGTDVVKNVADMIITDDNFSSIVVAVEEGRKIYSNIQKALQYLISTNCVEVFGMLISLLCFPKITFLSPAQMLFINLVTDSLPAFALGMENVENEIMRSPPRDSKKGLLGGEVGVAIIYQSILQTLLVMVVFVLGVVIYSPEVASTMTFFTIIFMQTLHSLNCKTNKSLLDKNLCDNKTFNFCFILTMMINLFVACMPFMYPVFGLELLTISQWITVAVCSILIIPLCEFVKVVLSTKEHGKNKTKKSKIVIKNT